MPKPSTDGSSKATPDPNGETVTTRVNVAFPFSQIKIQEPSEDLVALATLVRDIAELLPDIAPGPKARRAENARTGPGDTIDVVAGAISSRPTSYTTGESGVRRTTRYSSTRKRRCVR